MVESIAYMMNGRQCPYLQKSPDLLYKAYDALTKYYRECETARINLHLKLDNIFKEFEDMESLEKPTEPTAQ